MYCDSLAFTVRERTIAIPAKKESSTAYSEVLTESSSIIRIPTKEKTSPIMDDFLNGCFFIPNSPKESINSDATVCPNSPRATILVKLIFPYAKLLKTVELSVKLLRSSKDYVFTALYSGEARLCSYILHTSHNNIFNDILTDVSSSIGMSYRHMFRLLNQLCIDGLLDKRDNGYLIVNRDELIHRAADSS